MFFCRKLRTFVLKSIIEYFLAVATGLSSPCNEKMNDAIILNNEYYFEKVIPEPMDIDTPTDVTFEKLSNILKEKIAWMGAIKAMNNDITYLGDGWYLTKNGDKFPGDEVEYDEFCVNGVWFEGSLEKPVRGEKRKNDDYNDDYSKKFKLWKIETKEKKEVLLVSFPQEKKLKQLPQDVFILCGEPEPTQEIQVFRHKSRSKSLRTILLYTLVFLLCLFACVFRN